MYTYDNGYGRINMRANRNPYASSYAWVRQSHQSYRDWVLGDRSDGKAGFQMFHGDDGRGYWEKKDDKTVSRWAKPIEIIDDIQQRCVILVCFTDSISADIDASYR